MKVLILNSGMGRRMNCLIEKNPKCMTIIGNNSTILSRQLKILEDNQIDDVVITTGYCSQVLIDYCYSLNLNLRYTFVHNPIYYKTNYIYSIYLAREHVLNDLVIMHGDLVFDRRILERIVKESQSCMAVSSKIPVNQKDFKAIIEKRRIKKIGVCFDQNALTAQPLYKIDKENWIIWLNSIISYCEKGKVNLYAEDAFNDVSDVCRINMYDYKEQLCMEMDTTEDLKVIIENLKYSGEE